MAFTTRARAALLLALSSLLLSVYAQDVCPQAPTLSGTPSECNLWHTVVSGVDTCATVETQFGITSSQFLGWNPAVSSDCLSNFWAGYAYCVGIGTVSKSCSSSVKTTSTTSQSSSSTSSITSSTMSSIASSNTSSGNATYSTRWPIISYNLTTSSVNTAWPPSRTQAGQPSYCISWHLVNSGDTCQTIVNRYGATLSMDKL